MSCEITSGFGKCDQNKKYFWVLAVNARSTLEVAVCDRALGDAGIRNIDEKKTAEFSGVTQRCI
jgi:hypothetical protein